MSEPTVEELTVVGAIGSAVTVEEAVASLRAYATAVRAESAERERALREALTNWITGLDSADRVCPHGNSTRYPTSAWYCDDYVEAARAALRVSEEEAP